MFKQYKEEERTTRRKLREVRKILRQDIERLGQTLLVINLLLVPIIVGAFGILIYRHRTTKRRKTIKKNYNNIISKNYY